jgi:hypothetical protein
MWRQNMSDSPPSVSADEFILRRIHRNHYDSTQPLRVQPAAFRPSPADTGGLSVYRERFISPAEVAAAGRSAGDYFVARLSVQTLHVLEQDKRDKSLAKLPHTFPVSLCDPA